MAWENERSGWLKIKEGETKEFTIEEIVEKKEGGLIQPIPNKDYYYEFKTDLGTLTVNNLGLFSTLVNAKVRSGDRIRLYYVKRGSIGKPSKFEIDVLKRAEEVQLDNPFES